MAANYNFLVSLIVISLAAMVAAQTRGQDVDQTLGPIQVQASVLCVVDPTLPPKPIKGARIVGICKVQHQVNPVALIGKATDVNGMTMIEVDRVVGEIKQVLSCIFHVEITSLAQCNVAINAQRSALFVVPVMNNNNPVFTLPAFTFAPAA